MIFTTKQMLEQKAQELHKNKIGDWRSSYWINRFDYMSVCIDILKRHEAKSVLELGTNGIGLCVDSDTMGLDGNETFVRDATNLPWPIQDKAYDFFVALQVFEHLDVKRQKQIDCFKEACRISNNIILSLPFNWIDDEMHTGINDDTVIRWCSGMKWDEEYIIDDRSLLRKVYFWKNI